VTKKAQSGFTMLEVMLTVGILATLTMAVSSMMRANIDVRFALSGQAMVTHRLANAMQRVSMDIQHAFIVLTTDQSRMATSRRNNGIFRIELASEGDQLYLTTMTHQAMKANSNESDTTYVVYKLQESEEMPGRKDLFRGETKTIPEDFKEDPPLVLLARGVKGFKVRGWRGDEWSRDRWDTSRGEWRNKLPHMVQVEIVAWEDDPSTGGVLNVEDPDAPTMTLRSVIYIPSAFGMKELKEGSKASIRWF